MFIEPTGGLLQMGAMLPYFKKLPFADILFTDYTFSGIALLIINGTTNLTAAILLIRKKKLGVVLGGVFGVTLMLWICIQFYIFPPNVLSTIYFIFGFCQAVTGYVTYVSYMQENFSLNIDDYVNIGTNGKEVVVYFSRTGYVKKVAFELANKTGANIYEVKTTEKINGVAGFWWCGRFGMHRWDMPIENIEVDFSDFDRVIICSPIWVFSVAAPIRCFCKKVSRSVKNVDYVFVHFTNGKYMKTANELDKVLSTKRGTLTNVRCRMGKFKIIK